MSHFLVLFILSFLSFNLASSESWSESLPPSLPPITTDNTCRIFKEQDQLRLSEKEEKRKTTLNMLICDKSGTLTLTQNINGNSEVRAAGRIELDQALSSYVLDPRNPNISSKSDSGFRDIYLEIKGLPPESKTLASGYCQYSPKFKSAPCLWVNPEQCNQINKYINNSKISLKELNPKNILALMKSQAQPSERNQRNLNDLVNGVLKDIQKPTSQGGLAHIFSLENYQPYQDIVNKMADKIKPPEHVKTVGPVGSFFVRTPENLNQKLDDLSRSSSLFWNLDKAREWSRLISWAQKACENIKAAPESTESKSPSATNWNPSSRPPSGPAAPTGPALDSNK